MTFLAPGGWGGGTAGVDGLIEVKNRLRTGISRDGAIDTVETRKSIMSLVTSSPTNESI